MILILEDDKILAKNLKTILEMNKFQCQIAESAEQANKILKNNDTELIVLDINLPGIDGFSYLKQLRQNNNLIPVLILTSKATIEDKVYGLEIGADDYMTKPFDIAEFIARIKAILRRNTKKQSFEKIKLKDYEIFPEKEAILKNGRQIGLSSLEFKLLMFFIKNAGKILSREEIYENVWGSFDDYMFSRTVDVYINYIRKKLGKEIIQTKKGSGYYLPEEFIE